MVGMLKARLPEAQLGEVEDPRDGRGRRWQLAAFLTAVVTGVAVGCKSLAAVEALTAEMSPAVRRRLGIRRRVADTTMRDALVKVVPAKLRRSLHAQTKAAHRRKALEPDGLPFGVAAMDGKGSTATAWDRKYAQKQTHSAGLGAVGLVRTATCSLVSSKARACIDAIPIPASTNEMGHFPAAFKSLMQAYGKSDLFRLVSYDAGACCEAHGRLVVEKGSQYLFGLKGSPANALERGEGTARWAAAAGGGGPDGRCGVEHPDGDSAAVPNERNGRLPRLDTPQDGGACRIRDGAGRQGGGTRRPVLHLQLGERGAVGGAVAARGSPALGRGRTTVTTPGTQSSRRTTTRGLRRAPRGWWW